MLIRQAYQFQLKTNGAQARQMRRFAGSCRYVFNAALALQQVRYKAGENKLSYADLCSHLLSLKHNEQTAWLKEAPSQVLQQTLKDLERAYKNFFAKRADFPRFKKKGLSSSFRFPQGCKLDQLNNRILLPKLGWIQYRNSRDVLGEVKNVTVSALNGQWYMSIQTEREVADALHPLYRHNVSSVGIDMGIAQFASLSDGTAIAPLNSFKCKQAKLARYQRAMARKVKFSKNWMKAKRRVSNLHTHIANARRDFLHKASHIISKNHAVVFVEDLKVTNMSKSASGSMDKPGRNVSAKSGLNKAILDQGWFEFRRQLEYKLARQGGECIAVPAQYTSQRCSCCGTVSKENRQSQAKFSCVSCGYTANADLNAAINIRSLGMRQLADACRTKERWRSRNG